MKTTLRFFGIGLGKTGTRSLASAMEILGYSVKHGGQMDDVKDYEFLNDIAIAARWRYLDYYYGPMAKFILTIRDIDSWIKSSDAHAKGRSGERGKEGVIVGTHLARAEHRYLVYGITYYDEKIFRDVYANFNHEIINHFHGQVDRFLILNICAGDGWEKLCPFLDKPVPDKSFPHSHKRIY